jgi:hypothetical protein
MVECLQDPGLGEGEVVAGHIGPGMRLDGGLRPGEYDPEFEDQVLSVHRIASPLNILAIR